MGKYRGLYTCLACKKTMVFGEVLAIDDDKVASVARSIGDPHFELGPVAQERMPHVAVHECFPYGTKHIGVCLFAGFAEEIESEENDDDCEWGSE